MPSEELSDRVFIHEGQIHEYGESDILYLNNGSGKMTPVDWTSGAFRENGQALKAAPKDWGFMESLRDNRDADRKTLGYVKEQCSCTGAAFTVEDGSGSVVFTIEGPCCPCDGPCCTVEFPVMQGETQVGMLTKEKDDWMVRILSASTQGWSSRQRARLACQVSFGMALRPSSSPGASGIAVVVRTRGSVTTRSMSEPGRISPVA